MDWKYHTLPYTSSAYPWLCRLRGRPHAFSLQGGSAHAARYDIVGADPVAVIVTTGTETRIRRGTTESLRRDNPFDIIEQEVDAHRPASDSPFDLPFSGGAVGYFGYELVHLLERLPPPVTDALAIPDLVVGIYNWFITIDHLKQQACLVATPAVSGTEFERIKVRLMAPEPVLPNPVGSDASDICSSFDRPAYERAVECIKAYILDGDCYQVNLAQRFDTPFAGDPLTLFNHLMQIQQAPFAACLLGGDFQVLSFSPERFLRTRGRTVTTQPIKGTRPRGACAEEDIGLARELCASEKDRAENLMIVDLLRNDLGKCCEPGTIAVDRLFELQTFANVHHLVSTISGQLRPDVSPMQLLKASFPGGSITGAPKIRAMEVIRELEPCRRGPYCGAIGYYAYNGNLDTNLSIRTMVCRGGRAYYWGGGGVVADSTAAGEYQEALDKVDFIRLALAGRHGR